MAFSVSRIKNWYARNERQISSLALIGGFVFNAVALKRVDYFWENFWIIEHLLVVASCIFFLNRLENNKASMTEKKKKIHFWLMTIMQFTFGGLLSTFLVFYFRSTTLSVTWPFLTLLVIAFIVNERMMKYRSRIVFQISLFYISLYSFAIYIVPVFFHTLGVAIFILSGLFGLTLLILFLSLLHKFAHERFLENRHLVARAVLGIFLAVNILYFLRFIPPIPLSLKDGGIYHNVYKANDGSYVAVSEQKDWLTKSAEFVFGSDFYKMPGETVYAYSAVFSPPQFSVDLVHEWQKYDMEKKSWVVVSRIPLAVYGGREEGYRTYSRKSDVDDGLWRVNVKTDDGHVIGRLRFKVISSDTLPVLVNERKE